MPSKIINTLIPNDTGFSTNFNIDNYDKSENSYPILNIWQDIQLNLQQEEKINGFIYVYHNILITDTLESISTYYYNTDGYWWLILLVNDATDPFNFLKNSISNENGIKVLKSDYLQKVIRPNKSSDLSKYLGIKNG